MGEPAKIWSTDIRIGRGLILNQGASRRKRKLLHSILYTWIVHYGVISKFPRTGYSTSFFFHSSSARNAGGGCNSKPREKEREQQQRLNISGDLSLLPPPTTVDCLLQLPGSHTSYSLTRKLETDYTHFYMYICSKDTFT